MKYNKLRNFCLSIFCVTAIIPISCFAKNIVFNKPVTTSQNEDIKISNTVFVKKDIPMPYNKLETFDFQYDTETKTGSIIQISTYDEKWKQDNYSKKITLPNTVSITNGGTTTEYKITKFDMKGKWNVRKYPHTSNSHSYFSEVNTPSPCWIFLDFSLCSNLEIIESQCFSRNKDTDFFGVIAGVDFSGCQNLKTIGKEAFGSNVWANDVFQKFSKNGKRILDFSNTKLSTIGEKAFFDICVVNGEKIDYIYFPKTLTRLDPGAFGGNKYKLSALKVVLANSNPSDSLIGDNEALPNVWYDNKCVIVPYDSKNKYIKLPNHIQNGKHSRIKSDNSYFQSEIGWNSSFPGGNLVVNAVAGAAGSDNKSWDLFNYVSGAKCENVTFEINNSQNKLIFIDPKTHCLSWSEKLPAGRYSFAIIASIKNTAGEDSIVISDQVTLNLIESKLVGGSEYLRASSYQEKQTEDSKAWTLSLANKDELVSDLKYELLLPEELKDKIHLRITGEGKDKQCRLYWSNLLGIEDNIFNLKLKCTISLKNSQSVDCYKDIVFVVTSDTFEIKVVNEAGNEITQVNLIQNTPQKFFVRFYDIKKMDLPPPAFASLSNKPGIYVYEPKAIQGEQGWEYPVECTAGNGLLEDGIYDFFMHFEITKEIKGQKVSIPANSNVVKLVAGTDKPGLEFLTNANLVNGSDLLLVEKNNYGQDSNVWETTNIDLTKWKIDNKTISFKDSSWTTEEYKMRRDELFTEEQDNKISVKWGQNFCTDTNWLDIYDCNMFINIENVSTNQTFTMCKPLTFTATNNSKLISQCPFAIQGKTNCEGQQDDYWYLVVNNDIKLSDGNFEYSIILNSPDLKEGDIYMEPSSDKRSAKIKWKQLPRGVYSFSVLANNNEYFVQDSQNETLIIDDVLEIKNLPRIITSTQGQSGKSNALDTYLNNQKTVNARYSLVNPVQGITVNELTGEISWDGTTPIGQHQILIKSSLILGEEVMDAYSTTIFYVIAPASTNQTLWICLGSGLGAAAISAGIVLGINANKKKKKK